MNNQPTILGKKYIPLTENILLEYNYVADRYSSAAENPIAADVLTYDSETKTFGHTYGNSNNTPYYITTNKHVGELFFFNSHTDLTFNNIESTVLPINKSSNKWVSMEKVNGEYYSVVDEDWSDVGKYSEENLIRSPKQSQGEYVVYDILRIYFQAGYHTDYDGFVFNVYAKNKKNGYFNLLSTLLKNYDDHKLTSPFWFADKIYNACVEYRIPSLAYLSYDTVNEWGEDYDRSNPPAQTLPYFLTSGLGFYQNPSIGFDLYGVTGVDEKKEFKVYKTQLLTSTVFPNKDSYDRVVAVVEAKESHYEMFGYYIDNTESPVLNPYSLYNYMTKVCGTDFSLVHMITINQSYLTDDNVLVDDKPQIITFVQTGDMIREYMEGGLTDQTPVIKYRPVLKDGVVKASLNYVLRITNNRDTTTIIKTSNTEIINPTRFSSHLINISLDDSKLQTLHIYNRVEQGTGVVINSITKPLNVKPNKDSYITVETYPLTAFIDRRNMKVSVSPVKVQQIETTE